MSYSRSTPDRVSTIISEAALAVTDRAGTVIFFSQAGRQLMDDFSVPAAEVTEKLQAEVRAFQSILRPTHPAQSTTVGPAPAAFNVHTWRIFRKDHVNVTVQLRMHAVYSRQKEFTGFLILLANDQSHLVTDKTRVSSGNAGVFVTDPNGNCLLADANFLAITDRGLDENLGGGWTRALRTAERAAVLRSIIRAESVEQPVYIHQPGQRTVFATLAMKAIRYEDAYFGSVGIIRLPLDTSNGYVPPATGFDQTLDAAGTVVALHEPDGNFTYVSPSVTSVLGYHPAELLHVSPCALFHPDDRPLLRNQIRRIWLNGDEPATIRCRVRQKDTQWVALEVTVQSVLDAGGNMIRLQTRSVPVHPVRTQNEHRTEASSVQTDVWRELLTGLPFAACVISREPMQVIGANPAFYRVWSLPAAGATDITYNHFLTHAAQLGADTVAWQETVERMRQPELSAETHESALTDGRTIRWTISSFRQTNVRYWLFTFDDITAQKQRERELIQAKTQAEAVATAKQQFLSSMSHEIRTPMNAVVGMTHLLMQENPRPDQMDHLKTLKFSSDNLLVLVNDILDISKIDAGKITFEEVDFNLKDLIENIRNSLEFRANEKGIALHLQLDAALPEMVVGDSVRLAQVLNNLLSNAVKFTEVGSVTMDVRQEEESDESVLIRFSVQDTGIGISPNKLTYIFEGFSQATADVTRRFGGTGLGLNISKRLLEMQGSHIAVESRVGQGSTFYFSLRFKKSQKPPAAISNEPIQYDAADLSGVRLLLVEDNEINQIVAAKFLGKLRIQPDFASNGQLALEKIQSKAYDLVLMDLQMPEMDGYEATQAIRNLPDDYFRQIPIIALTAAVIDDTREKAERSGITDFTSKPINPGELYKKILTYASGRTTTEPPVPLPELPPTPLDNLLQICHDDPAGQQQMLLLSKSSFLQFRENYEQALLARDKHQLEGANHYMKTLFHMLHLPHLADEVQRGKSLIASPDTSVEALQTSIRLVTHLCDHIIADIDGRLARDFADA